MSTHPDRPSRTRSTGRTRPVPDGGSIRCPDCCLLFDSEEKLREHAREKHDLEEPLDGET